MQAQHPHWHRAGVPAMTLLPLQGKWTAKALLIDGNIAGKPLLLSALYFEPFCSRSSPQALQLQNPQRLGCVSCAWWHSSESSSTCSTSFSVQISGNAGLGVLDWWVGLCWVNSITLQGSHDSPRAFCFCCNFREDDVDMNSPSHWPHLSSLLQKEN